MNNNNTEGGGNSFNPILDALKARIKALAATYEEVKQAKQAEFKADALIAKIMELVTKSSKNTPS